MLGNQKKRTKIIDIIEFTLKQKWKWAGHIARLKDRRIWKALIEGYILQWMDKA